MTLLMSSEARVLAPDMEVICLHLWPQSRRHSASLTATIYVSGLGEVECKDLALSEETVNAVKRDLMLGMEKKLRRNL